MPLKKDYKHSKGFNIPKSKSKSKTKLKKLSTIYVSCRMSKSHSADRQKNKAYCAKVAHAKSGV